MQGRRAIAGRFLRAAVGLRYEPPTDKSLTISLIENGWTETMGMGAWIPAWATTGALLLLTGRGVHSWDQPIRSRILTLAAMPMAISVVGFIIHMCRAAMALSVGRNLALKKQPGGAYERAVAWLTTTTPWVLVPQVLIGVGLAIFSRHTPSSLGCESSLEIALATAGSGSDPLGENRLRRPRE